MKPRRMKGLLALGLSLCLLFSALPLTAMAQGTIKYQLVLSAIGGSGGKDFTAKVGGVGDRSVMFELSGLATPASTIPVTYSIGTVSNTDNMVDPGNAKAIYLLSSDLNKLPAGDYPIRLSSPGDDQHEGFERILGTAHIEKYTPVLSGIDGNGSKDFTAKVGDVGDRAVQFNLSGLANRDSTIPVTYSIGTVSSTDNMADAGAVKAILLFSSDLNSLPAGDYPIKLSSPGDDQHEGFERILGTAHIEKYTPVLNDIRGNGSEDFTAKAGDVGDREVRFTPSGLVNSSSSIPVAYSVGTVSNTFTAEADKSCAMRLFSSNLSSLPAGDYPIKLSSPGDDQHEDFELNLGTATLAGVTGVMVSPTAPTLQRGGAQQFSADVGIVSTPDYPVDGTVTWTVTGNRSSATKIDQTGLLTVGADETADALTVQAESNYENGSLGKEKGSTEVSVLPPAVTGVTVSPASISVLKGSTHPFSADVAVVSGANGSVQWTVEGGKSAGTKIDQSGLLTVGADETADTLTVRATSVFDSTQSGTADVTPTNPPLPDVGPQNPPDPTVPVDTNADLNITFNGAWENVSDIRLNGVSLTRTPTSPTTADLSGYGDYKGTLGAAKKSSVAVTLYKEFLSALPNGDYKLEVEFGSLSAVGAADFLVKNEPKVTPTPAPTATVAPTATPAPGTNPKTGDAANTLAWILLMLATLAGCAALASVRKRGCKKHP